MLLLVLHLLLVFVMLRLDLIDHLDDFTVYLLHGLWRLVRGLLLHLDLLLEMVSDERGFQRLAIAADVVAVHHRVDPLLAHV